MEKQPDIIDYKKVLESELSQKFPGIQEKWESLTNEIGPALYELLKNQTQQEILKIEGFGELHFSLVIDTNFIFGQIKSSVTKSIPLEETFIYNLVNCSFITVHVPFKLHDELFEKIEVILESGKEEAIKHANILLENVVMMDAFWAEDWKVAKRTIGNKDPDDVSFLALSLHTKGNGILSFDKIFKNQNLTKAWGINDTESVIHTFNHGILSLGVVGISVSLLQLLYNLISIIARIILDVVVSIVTAIIGISVLIFHSIGKIPVEILIGIVGLTIVSLFFSDDIRQGGKELLHTFMERISSFSESLIEFLSELQVLLKEFWELFKPHAVTSIELFAYLAVEIQSLLEKLNEFELAKAKP